MITLKLKHIAILYILIVASGCDLVDPKPISDPNNPSVGDVLQNANREQLQNLITGLEVRNRDTIVGFSRFAGTFGREILPMFVAESRNLDIIYGLSKGASAETNPDFFGNGNAWDDPYSTIKQANIIIESLNNTDNVNEQEKNGYLGVVQTFKALNYLIPLLTQKKENGIRIDVEDPLNPGPFVPYNEALTQIRNMLDDAQAHLQAAGDNFVFELTEGLPDFNSPSTFEQLNRAIAARIAIYAKDWEGTLELLEKAKPFFELSSGESVVNKGAYFIYSGPPDSFNPYYEPHNIETSGIVMVEPSMIDDAETGDKRFQNKFFKRDVPIVVQGLTASFQDDRFKSNTSPIPWLRNEELILIYAEAKAQLNNFSEANKAINYVRNTWGLSDFSSNEKAEIIDQILYERRYSLWKEYGHRWIDAKRYDRLEELPKSKGQIYQYLARPQSELN